MSDSDLNQRRLAVLIEHFESEVVHDFDATLATFAHHAHYEIIPTGQIIDGDEDVLAYHRNQRTAFPDQRQENVTYHFADDSVVSEFDLLGTNLGEFYGLPPTGKTFRVPMIAVFFFEGDKITSERIYFDAATLAHQIGRGELLALLGDPASSQ